MTGLSYAKVLHGIVNRSLVYKQFKELQQDAFSGRLRPNKNCDIAKGYVGFINRSNLG